MFLRSHALEEAHVELQEREEILRELSNKMAEERADERLSIAGYLHDDLAQVLFRLSLQVDIARKMLDKQDLEDLKSQLEKIKDSKQETSDRIRALIRELHRSPLGATGLGESLESFTDEVGRDSGIRFHHDVQDIDLPAPIALLIFHIAREGVMNALKHADPADVWIAVTEAEREHRPQAPRQRLRVRHDRSRPRGSLRDGDDARAREGRWRHARRRELTRRRHDDHGSVPDVSASAGSGWRYRTGIRQYSGACFPRYAGNQNAIGRGFSRRRPRMICTIE